jgi:photosystem II stability/assembly factor-like uncharacterized protein
MGAMSCPRASVCYTAQGDARCQCELWGPYGTIFGTQDGGNHWRLLYRAKGGNYPTGPISCPGISVCYAVGATQRDVPADRIILSTKNGGRTWTAHGLPAAPLLSCPDTTVCYGGNYGAAVTRTADGGATWQTLP